MEPNCVSEYLAQSATHKCVLLFGTEEKCIFLEKGCSWHCDSHVKKIVIQ
jgi:hypothetical protein